MERTVGIEPTTYRLDSFAVSIPKLVDVSGIEPLTYSVSSCCTTAVLNILKLAPMEGFEPPTPTFVA